MSPQPVATLRSLISQLRILKKEPPMCQALLKEYSSAQLPACIHPAKLEDAIERAASVNSMATPHIEQGALIVKYRGHALDDGVVIWRSGKGTYHMLSWWDPLD